MIIIINCYGCVYVQTCSPLLTALRQDLNIYSCSTWWLHITHWRWRTRPNKHADLECIRAPHHCLRRLMENNIFFLPQPSVVRKWVHWHRHACAHTHTQICVDLLYFWNCLVNMWHNNWLFSGQNIRGATDALRAATAAAVVATHISWIQILFLSLTLSTI